MPTTVILKSGGQLNVKGDSVGTAIFGNLLHPSWAFAVALNGRRVQFKKRLRIGYVFQPEAEAQAEQEAQKSAQEAQAKAQAEAQAKAEKDRADALKKASEDFIAKYGPDPAKWPESMRPKAPAETEPSVAPGC